MAQDRSILDFVTGEVAALRRTLGTGDRGKLGEYLEAVRDVERRIQTAERQSTRELPVVEQPMGIPDSFEAHARLMYDLLALAYQCDLTRVATFMIGKEVSGRAYPEIGVPDGHHACSHHQNDPVKLEKLAKINRYHMEQFAYFLDRLAATPDGDGSLLDHSMFVYGSGISDGNIHFHLDLPTVVVGGRRGDAARRAAPALRERYAAGQPARGAARQAGAADGAVWRQHRQDRIADGSLRPGGSGGSGRPGWVVATHPTDPTYRTSGLGPQPDLPE